MTGNQENSKDQTPYFLKYPPALIIIFFSIGNQDLFGRPDKNPPIAQLIMAPAVFPKVAIRAKTQVFVFPPMIVAINTASDVAGTSVAERSAEKKTALHSRTISNLIPHLPKTGLQTLMRRNLNYRNTKDIAHHQKCYNMLKSFFLQSGLHSSYCDNIRDHQIH